MYLQHFEYLSHQQIIQIKGFVPLYRKIHNETLNFDISFMMAF